jgi:hypothetical protein
LDDGGGRRAEGAATAGWVVEAAAGVVVRKEMKIRS